MGYQRAQTLRRFAPAARGFLAWNPWLRGALNLWDVWKFLNNNNTAGQSYTPSPAFGGWTLQHDCGRTATHIYSGNNGNTPHASTICFGSSLGSSARPLNSPLPAAWGRFVTARLVGYQSTSPFGALYAAAQYYYKPAPDYPAGLPVFRQFQQTDLATLPRGAPYVQSLDPHRLPIQQPWPYPLPLPLQKRTEAWPQGYRAGYGPPRPVATRPGQVRKPPPKRTKEAKLRMGALAAALVRSVNALTESADLLDAIFAALPADCRKGIGPRQYKRKAAAVYRCADHIDWDTAVFNIVWMSAEDYAWGALGLPTKPFGRLYASNMGANKLLSQTHGDELADQLDLVERIARERFQQLTGFTLV